MKIKLNTGERTIRETSAPFEYTEGEELKTADIRVLYYSPTTKESRELSEKFKNAEKNKETIFTSELLLNRLHALPDLVDENDDPHKITLEFLDSMTTKNINAIADAVNNDISPKSQPAK